MKKTISLKKVIEFPTMIGEVTAISLEENLKFLDESNIAGEFEITGRYKMTEASRIEEDFNYKIPVEILLTEKVELTTAKADVEDFYYEIENDDTMICYIDVKIEGVELIEELEEKEEPILIDVVQKEERCIEIEEAESIDQENNEKKQIPDQKEKELSNRECDSEYIEMNKTNDQKEIAKEEITPEFNQKVGSLFSSFKDSDETFTTYSVYILRQDETIQTIIEKYSTTKEELEKYNDLTNLSIGTKLIIPNSHE